MNLRLLLAGAVWSLPVLLLACGEDPAGEGGAVLETVDLGSVSLSDTGAYTEAVEVELPENTTSVMAWCGGYGDQALGALWTHTDPSGGTVYDADAGSFTFRADFLDDMAPVVLPLSPATAPSPGLWSFNWWIGAGNGGTVDCGAVIRTDQAAANATIDVEIVLVGLDGLDAATAPDHPGLQDAMSHFAEEWASGGLTPNITYEDFGGDVVKYGVVDVSDDDYSEFNDLLRTASPGSDRAMTFFLVSEIANASADGATILGLSAGPPGAAGVQGTSKSGVIITAADLDSDPTRVAKIMAHEGGHFLGLYHTTEKDASMSDPLGDTPECPSGNDADGNGSLSVGECTGAGGENVMFWTLTEGTASLSADQGFVLRNNPVSY